MALTSARTTQSASSLAQQTLDEEERKKREKQAKGTKQKQATNSQGTLGGPAGGAAAGATAGAVAGPIGAIVGAGVGAVAGAADANKASKDAASSDPNRPERRRLAKGVETFQATKRNKERALATLSQAVFDWAASIR